MSIRRFSVLLALVLVPVSLAAQHGGGGPPVTAAPKEASQFDFLLGEWELTVKLAPTTLAQRIHGTPKLVATWKAARALDGWGISDELRITDAAGNPMTLSHSVRLFDQTARQWKISAIDVYRARFTSVTGDWQNGEMHIASQGTSPDGKPTMARTRLYDIKPDSFKFEQDRSEDGGKTWVEGALRMEARRAGTPAR